VRVLYIARGVGNHERVTEEWVREKYAVEARQYADFATLRGDTSDGLPVVKGVGEKTAATLLQRFEHLDGIVAAAADPAADMAPGVRAKVTASADYLAVAPEVVAVRRSLDVPRTGFSLPAAPADEARLAALAAELNLEGPVERLTTVLTNLNG